MSKTVSRMPGISPVEPGKIPEAANIRLQNRIPVYLIEAGTEDICRLEFTFGAGTAFEDVPLLASTVNLMLTEGTRKLSSAKLNKLIDYYGAFFHQYCERDRSGIIIFCMNKYIDKILELAREILFYPAFQSTELRPLMKKRLRSWLINRDKINTIASDQFFESIFGNHHPYGRKTYPEDFKIMYPGALKDFHSRFYTAENMAIIVSGKIRSNLADLLNNYFGGIFSHKTYIEESCGFLEKQPEKRVHIEKKGAVQTAVKIGSPEINKRQKDYQGLKILDTILGGYFGSRLMKNIREDKGYTYGISSLVTSFNLSGFKVISAEVSKKNTQKAIDEIFREIRLLQTYPVETEELNIVRNYMLGDMIRMFDGPFALAESFRSVWEFGLDNSYYYRLAKKIKSIEPDEITAIAQTYYDIDELYVITAG